MTNLKAIGRRVAELRIKAGLTQEELADAVGVARGTLGSIETGGGRAGIETTIAIADHFKVPMDWLLCREVPTGGPLIGQFVDDPEELAWLAFWRGLTADERAAAAKMFRLPDAEPSVLKAAPLPLPRRSPAPAKFISPSHIQR
jgi:transcriptional regulator with XRE-family HTH domain